jgi:predicted acylesterase/phospholipase RssA
MFDAVSFPGGGNRCYWQGGFWEAAAGDLGLAPGLVVGVSGGAFAASYSLLGLGAEVRSRVYEGCALGRPDLDWRALLKGGDAFPVAPMYRALLEATLTGEAFARLNAATDLRIMIARPPRRWPATLAALAGLASYQIEKKLMKRVHPRWGARLGFAAEFVAVRGLPDARALQRVAYASACVPPIIPLQTVGGRPALDGGMVDNAPVGPLADVERQGGRSLVLLTRRYAAIPAVANRTYVQPSQPIAVGQFAITSPEGIRAAWELGRRDGAAFVRSMRPARVGTRA